MSEATVGEFYVASDIHFCCDTGRNPEANDGNVEYKLQLLNPCPAHFAQLVTQMKRRLLERRPGLLRALFVDFFSALTVARALAF